MDVKNWFNNPVILLTFDDLKQMGLRPDTILDNQMVGSIPVYEEAVFMKLNIVQREELMNIGSLLEFGKGEFLIVTADMRFMYFSLQKHIDS